MSSCTYIHIIQKAKRIKKVCGTYGKLPELYWTQKHDDSANQMSS